MQVLSGFANDRSHDLHESGAYEWWYADAQSSDGEWGFVVILFRGMPMSPDYLADVRGRPGDHPALAISVYHQGARIAFAVHGTQQQHSQFSQNGTDVIVLTSSMTSTDDGCIHIRVNTASPQEERSIEIDAVFQPRVTITPSVAPFQSPHGWVLVAPWCDVTATVILRERGVQAVKVTWTGSGYRDHNMGHRQLGSDFGRWLWGRVHTDEATWMYLALPDGPHPFLWLGRCTLHGLDVGTAPQLTVVGPRRTFMGLRVPRSIVVTAQFDDGEHTIRCDNNNTVENGPFYQRYLSAWSHNGKHVGQGMSEFLDAQRLCQPWIRPFLRLPWQRIV